ncbi:glycosyltransferase [Nostoc sp. LEGE 06077]|uniref:glycosyltransferase n=1 Tax=Nostoc sp. LEGE 06077 TaxID=915325 RepID=UPI00188100C6|nr:glycosyltransferase [Nostoc sp. LEGE 06077]MBE9207152.1 glycosyltransferase [Nostoc sp. LEGE 06077]
MNDIELNHSFQWVKDFQQKYGRKPSILHIGNIANNAYNNAKLLNKIGFDCDVICYDYYHIMGCPEWEDADFEGEIKDQFFPDWNSVELKQFQRPKWFAQGYILYCLFYLTAKRQNKVYLAWFWWQVLEIHRFYRCSMNGNVYKIISRITKSLKLFIKQIIFIKHYIFGFVYQKFRIILLKKILKRVLNISHKTNKISQRNTNFKNNYKNVNYDERTQQIIETFKYKFPNRKDQLVCEDLEGYRYIILLWKKLFDSYDIIQGYSTDPILPLITQHPYFAFEHGTLRDIPFEPTAQGRLTSIAYSQAEHVFVTNSDCINNAILLAGENVSGMNHPYDENHGLQIEGWQELRQKLCQQLDADFLFFFPTRHDWVVGTGYADKGNEIFLNAFCNLRQAGYKVGMVCCMWGANVQDSIKLLTEKDCADFVLWSQPMGTIKFERTAKACHVVVDQFKLGSFGGIVFKAMAVAAPICTYINEDDILKQYSELPPVINCKSEDEIFSKMEDIIENPDKLLYLASLSKLWIDKYHSSWDTIKTQMLAYEKFLDKQGLLPKS